MNEAKAPAGMPETMKALVVRGPGDYRLEEIPVPACGGDDVVIKVMASGICGSDIKCWHGSPYIWGGAGRGKYIQEPVVAGHEFFGKVVAVGPAAAKKHGVALGDYVVPEQIVPCGVCRLCRTGAYNICQQHDIFGFIKDRAEGGFAEYARLPIKSRIHKFPEGFDLDVAAYIEPLGCAIHAVERANVQFADVVAVAGLGPVGLGMLQACVLKNPKEVIAIDLQDKRLGLAREYGATVCLNPAKQDVEAEVDRLTDGYGCDVYIHASGNPKGVLQGLRVIRKGGRYVEYSVFSEDVTADWSMIGDGKEIDIIGGHLSPWDCYASAIRFLHDGRMNAARLITHRLPLDQWLDGFKMVEKGSESIKVLLIP
ncbi:MAG: alcohol dehydrogenase catalytic domain-containing protein [Planctomycetota bacterium]|jgi:L-iditol 2-dehydrogenase|nr:alcohol dehydrogenase catalytic domain-containing protein [Planctomycetota bacterium]